MSERGCREPLWSGWRRVKREIDIEGEQWKGGIDKGRDVLGRIPLGIYGIKVAIHLWFLHINVKFCKLYKNEE